MKRVVAAITVGLALTVLLLVASCTTQESIPTPTGASPAEEIELAQSKGQAFINGVAELAPDYSEWKNARLVASQPLYDLKGQVIAYMFAIQNNDMNVGHIVIGNGSYGYPMFQCGKDTPPSVPSADEIKSSLERDLGLKIGEEGIGEPTHIVYLGYPGFYAIYEIEGKMVGINLRSARAVLTSNMKSTMPSPEEYKASQKKIAESKPESLP